MKIIRTYYPSWQLQHSQGRYVPASETEIRNTFRNADATRTAIYPRASVLREVRSDERGQARMLPGA